MISKRRDFRGGVYRHTSLPRESVNKIEEQE